MADPVLFKLSATNGFRFKTSVIVAPPSIDRAANFEGQGIMNRSSPIWNYVNSNSKTVTLPIRIVKLSSKDGTLVTDLCSAFESLVLPEDPGVKPPPVCTIDLMGSLIKNMRSLCFSVNIAVSEDLMFEESGDPRDVTITVNFVELEIENTASAELLRGGGLQQLAVSA